MADEAAGPGRVLAKGSLAVLVDELTARHLLNAGATGKSKGEGNDQKTEVHASCNLALELGRAPLNFGEFTLYAASPVELRGRGDLPKPDLQGALRNSMDWRCSADNTCPSETTGSTRRSRLKPGDLKDISPFGQLTSTRH